MNQVSHVRCRCGLIYPLRDGRGLCPRCVSLSAPPDRTPPVEHVVES